MHTPLRVFEGGNVQSAKRYRRNFVEARSEASTQQNSEKPPLDIPAGRAMDCIGKAAIIWSFDRERKVLRSADLKLFERSQTGNSTEARIR
jgi:hypothetical protein